MTAEGHTWEVTCYFTWGMGLTIDGLVPGCPDLPKAKAEKFQEASQSFHWASIWLQSHARRPDKSRAGRRQKTQARAAARKAPPSSSIHMKPNGGCWREGAGPTWATKALRSWFCPLPGSCRVFQNSWRF